MKSKRHHFIPEFYIKGFVNDGQTLFVFDKHKNRFKSGQFSARQIFFEWNRNTLCIDGKEDDFIENLYSNWDSSLSPSYNKIISQIGEVKYEALDLFSLMTLTSLLYWRIPEYDKKHSNAIKNIPDEDLLFKIYESATNKEVTYDYYKEFRQRPGFEEIYKIAKPVTDYLLSDPVNNVKNWKIYSAIEDRGMHILGDNPIIIRNERDNVLEAELILPLSKDKLLVNLLGPHQIYIQPKDRVQIDIILFKQSRKYVVGPNREYLYSIFKASENYDLPTHIELSKSELFKKFSK